MRDKLWSAFGTVSATVDDALVGASEEHRRFMSSGFRCPKCDVRLTNALGNFTTNYFAADGSKLSQWTGGALRAETVGCPNCGHRWKRRGNSKTTAPVDESFEIIETVRSEEFLGEDRRIIDNSASAAGTMRKFAFTKEWSKSYRLEFEQARSAGAEFSLGASDAGLKLSSENKLQSTYAVSRDTKETCAEEVSCEAPGRSILTIVVRWKRIWQHGYVEVSRPDAKIRIPFRVTVGMTFDQRQIDGPTGD